uniref:Uncharacterized protein n=1 Tax=Solanum tuberosum TaxID=4113 RepID=M1DYC5_SOLTU
MPNSESSSKAPLSQEVENPSSFDFSIPILEDSPSTPVCGAGEMDESFSPQTEITASLVPSSDEVLVCSPTLVFSGDKSQNSEAQSVAKPSAELLSEETELFFVTSYYPKLLWLSIVLTDYNGTWSSAEYEYSSSVKVLNNCKVFRVRKLVKLQSTSPIRSDEVVCTLDNDSSWYISNNKQHHSFIHSKRNTFKLQNSKRPDGSASICFQYQLHLSACNSAYI